MLPIRALIDWVHAEVISVEPAEPRELDLWWNCASVEEEGVAELIDSLEEVHDRYKGEKVKKSSELHAHRMILEAKLMLGVLPLARESCRFEVPLYYVHSVRLSDMRSENGETASSDPYFTTNTD